MSDSKSETLRVTSLDEAFDVDMRATVAGARQPQAEAVPPPVLPELLGYLHREYGLERLERAPDPPSGGGVGGLLRRLARRFFVSRTYHASLVSALAELDARQRASEARVEALLEAQRDYDEVLARTLFKLWGDYNYVVREIIPSLLEAVRTAEDRTTSRLEGLTEAQRAGEATTTAMLEDLTGALREAEARLGEMEGPHDRTVASVAELVAGLGREESLARRLEALEQRIASTDA